MQYQLGNKQNVTEKEILDTTKSFFINILNTEVVYLIKSSVPVGSTLTKKLRILRLKWKICRFHQTGIV